MSKQTCKTCGKSCEGEFCFIHKKRKPLNNKAIVIKPTVVIDKLIMEEKPSMREFFINIWKKRYSHKCENCGVSLGKEPLSYMFDHVLEKSKYPDLKFEEENIMFLCLECHDNKTRGITSDLIKERIEELRKKFKK